MRVQDLFEAALPEPLQSWLHKFEQPHEPLLRIEDLFFKLDKQVVRGEIDDHVSIQGAVHIGEGSRIHSHVSIVGPVIIGENVSIRSHAQIRNCAFIGSDCVVGHGADIKKSICLDKSKIQDGTFVGDSILGVGTRIGSGAILANRKFNQSEIKISINGERVSTGLEFFGAVLGDYVRLGANVVTSPGTIIGPHTWVGSGVVLNGTYDSDQLITLKQELDIRNKDRLILRTGEGEYESI